MTPLCRHFGPCGGCDWQHLAYPDQLARKRDRLRQLLHSTLGARAPDVRPVIGMQPDDTGWPWGFRHKASFVFGDARLPPRGRARGTASCTLTIGHYAAGSRHVVPIVECPVHAPRANRIAFALHAHLARAGIPAAGPSLRGVLRHLLVRITRDGREAVAMLVVTRNDRRLRAPIRAFLAGDERPTGFFLNVHDRPGPFMVGPETVRLDGRGHAREEVGGASFIVSPTAFFQTNVDAARVLVDLVLAEAPATRPLRALDLYAGVGLFTLPLAARGHHVTAVEEHAQAVRDADANLRLNRQPADRVRLMRARVEEVIGMLGRPPFDVAVIDPPRQGCHEAVLHGLFGGLAPPRVVYVSCNPEAIARELPHVLDHGYDVRSVQPVDMFPHTTHMETVVVLGRESRWAGGQVGR